MTNRKQLQHIFRLVAETVGSLQLEADERSPIERGDLERREVILPEEKAIDVLIGVLKDIKRVLGGDVKGLQAWLDRALLSGPAAGDAPPTLLVLPAAIDAVAAYERCQATVGGGAEAALMESLRALRHAVYGRRRPLVVDLAEHPKAALGLRVRTAQTIRPWGPSCPRSARPGVTGTIVDHSAAAGVGHFVVAHDGGDRATYLPDELTIIGRAT